MRRILIGIAALLITFATGTGADSFRRYLFTPEPVTVEKDEPATPVVAAPVIVTPAPVTPPATKPETRPNLILDYNLEKFDHYGTLNIMGPKPEGFQDFECIALGLPGIHESEGFESISIGTNGTSYETIQANFALVTEKYLYFTTEPGPERGYQYRFEGEFLVKNFGPVMGKNIGAVRGTLTKSRNGRTLAEHTVTFWVDYMGC